jgi:hypothetical protein
MLLLTTGESNKFVLLSCEKSLYPLDYIFFLWLLTNNKVLTRDNLLKRRELNDVSCLFCTENESVNHLFFGCCVAKVLWHNLSIMFDKSVGNDFESVAGL